MALGWTTPPVTLEERDFSDLALACAEEPSLIEAWLAGRERLLDGEDVLAVAFVVDEPLGASERPEMIALIERLTPVVSDFGLDVRSWAFVSPVTAEREIAECGRRIYAADTL